MNLEEYHAKVLEHDTEEDDILTALEAGKLEDAQANPKLADLDKKRAALEKEFDASPPDDEPGEEEEEEPEEEADEIEPVEGVQPEETHRDDKGRFASVPYQPTAEQKRRDALVESLPD